MPQQPDNADIAAGQLGNVWLEAITFRENHDFDLSKSDELQYSIEYEIQAEPHEHDEAGWFTDVRVPVAVNWTPKEGYDGPVPFELTLTLAATFDWLVEPPEDPRKTQSWVEYNAVNLLWPYIRNYIWTISGMGSAPPLMLFTIVTERPSALEPDDEDDVELPELEIGDAHRSDVGENR